MNIASPKRKTGENKGIHSKLKSISEMSVEHYSSMIGVSSKYIEAKPTEQGIKSSLKRPNISIEASKEAIHRSSIDKGKIPEIKEDRDRESERDSLTQSKASLDPRVPIKKISITNIDGSSSNPSPMPSKQKGEILQNNSFIKSSSILSPKESRDSSIPSKPIGEFEKIKQGVTSLVLETPSKLKKTPSALNTVNVR